ncbi:phosphotransferase family protein [Paractinoplanes rhizophilus]|uniref:Phosphotransferase family protein n=1 Tax=Paractinoplanes rhizophilus TaxID=1416877 RepID=A0ABW2HQW7_9ACTN
MSDSDLVVALKAGWDIEARKIAYLPVGAGGYHWTVDGRWFLTVTADESGPLERALRTARALRRDAGLSFVVAAEPGHGGSPLWSLPSGPNLSVFPLVDGEAGSFGPHPADRDRVVDMLVALHRATPVVAAAAPPSDLRPPGGDFLRAAPTGDRWAAGPYAAAAQDLLATHAAKIEGWLARLADLAAGFGPARVVTHGEPHPGNILRTASGPRLIDWDTVRLAPPERDLWLLTGDPFAPGLDAGDAALARYADATGHRVSPAALAFYQLRWTLADVAAYARDLSRPHGPGGDAEDALGYLRGHLEG